MVMINFAVETLKKILEISNLTQIQVICIKGGDIHIDASLFFRQAINIDYDNQGPSGSKEHIDKRLVIVFRNGSYLKRAMKEDKELWIYVESVWKSSRDPHSGHLILWDDYPTYELGDRRYHLDKRV